MRHRFLFLLVILLTFGASAVQAQDTGKPAPVYFQVSSINSPFALAGTFEGEYRVRADAIEITISNAAIYLRDNCPYKGRRELAFINVSLATSHPSGKWTVINSGRAIPVGETMTPGDKYLADKLRFSIPKDSSLDLSNCWLVVEMGEISLDSSDACKVGYSFAQSDRGIFSPLVVKAAKK